jgi:EmrB/QacA subfamily drug resistance transporter
MPPPALSKTESQSRAAPPPVSDAPEPLPSSPVPSAPPSAPSPTPLSPADVRAIFIGLMLTSFLAALNQTIVAPALPTLGRHFGDFQNLSWIVTAYLLTSTAVAPLYGKLSDIHGRRAMMLVSIGIFLAGSAVCAAASNMLMLILGRALQGLGGGGIFPIAQAIMADTITPRERGRFQAYMGTVWITSGVGGPILGGFLAEHFSWQAIFWLNVPIGLAAAVMTHRNLKRLPRHDRKHKLDLVGAALMMAAAVALLLALNWGGTRFPWLSPTILGLIALSGAISLVFAWRLTGAPEPFLPIAVLANPIMRTGTVATSMAMAVSVGLTIMLPLYFEVVHGMTATASGLALIPLALTTPGSILSGRAMMRGRRYKWVPLVALAFAVVALIFLTIRPDAPLTAVLILMSVVGTGIGTVYPVATVAIQNAVSRYQVGVAMGAMNFFRALTSAFAVAIMGAVVLAGYGSAPERGGGGVKVLSPGLAAASGLDLAFTFRWVFAVSALFLALGILALLLMEERPLRGPGDPVAVPAE